MTTTKKKPPAPPAPPTLTDVAAVLSKTYGKAPPVPSHDPFGLILWEQCAYLADDATRAAAFAALEKKTKLAPKKVLALSPEELLAFAKAGGPIAAEDRAERMRAAAQLVVDEHGGDLLKSLAEKAPADRRKALKKFAQIGPPGADKILLLSKLERVLGLESNGLRVVVRLGHAREDKSYDKMWKAARDAVEPQLPADIDDVINVHQLLRRHGQTVCTRTKPKCPECPLRPSCAYGRKVAPLAK